MRTPRLLLTPLADEDLAELLEVVLAGIHAPDAMPFDMPWSTQPRAELVINSLKHYWTQRAVAGPADWEIQFGVHLGDRVIGVQGLHGTDFSALRTVETGSWLGMPFQGQGIGTEMRAAVLMFAFDHLGAVRAESAAFLDNPSSLGVSRKLGYQANGRQWKQRRPGDVAENERLLLAAEAFIRPDWHLDVRGLQECRDQLGI